MVAFVLNRNQIQKLFILYGRMDLKDVGLGEKKRRKRNYIF